MQIRYVWQRDGELKEDAVAAVEASIPRLDDIA